MQGPRHESPSVAVLHDGSEIPVLVSGEGPAVLLPVRFDPYGTNRRSSCGSGERIPNSDRT